MLELYKVLKGKGDGVLWLKEEFDVFSVRSCYSSIVEDNSFVNTALVLEKACSLLWTTQAPMKIKIFG